MAKLAGGKAVGRKTGAVLSQNAIPFLLHLADNPGWHAPSRVAKAIGAQTKWVPTTVSRLRKAGLLEIEATGRRAGRTTHQIRLTTRGERVAGLLRPVVAILDPGAN